MALLLSCYIEVGPYVFNHAHQIDIESTWRELGSKCTIMLPKLSNQLFRTFRRGDEVLVKLGYDGNDRVVFRGYVKLKKPNMPFELECEDGTFKLRLTRVNGGKPINFRRMALRDILKQVLGSVVRYKIDESLPDIQVELLQVGADASVADVINKLREDYLFAAYFRDGYLWMGLPYLEFEGFSTKEEAREKGAYAVFDMQNNVIKEDITFKAAEDVKIKIKAISFLPRGKRLIVEVGDSDGELRTLHFRNIKDKGTLKLVALREMEKYKIDGFSGTLTGFGVPFIVHSGTVRIVDGVYPQRQGNFVVDRVKYSWGVNGYRQEVEVGKRVSSE